MRTVCLVVLSLLVLGLGAIDPAEAYTPPARTVAEVATAIGYSRPGLSLGQRRAWAAALIGVAKKHRFDALTGWAIIHHESRWRPDAVSADGHDVGLGQIRVTLRKACADPASASCAAERQRMFDPATNMAVMGSAITAWRTLCKKTGKADLKHWLAGYGGYSRPPKTLCGRARVRSGKGWRWRDLPTPGPVRDIIQLRLRMIKRLARGK